MHKDCQLLAEAYTQIKEAYVPREEKIRSWLETRGIKTKITSYYNEETDGALVLLDNPSIHLSIGEDYIVAVAVTPVGFHFMDPRSLNGLNFSILKADIEKARIKALGSE